MKIRRCSSTHAFLLASLLFLCARVEAQFVKPKQTLLPEGILSTSQAHSPTACGPDGTRFILLDDRDSIRIRKTDKTGSTILAEAHLGAKGDSAIALAVDPAGNVYVVGTSSSGALTGSSGAAFPRAADRSTNSFLAKYDGSLNLIFMTFLGAGDTAATGVAATADAVFVTGKTSTAAFPTTPSVVQRTPYSASNENGFVERFRPDGSALVYATYLSGADGSTLPTGVVADSQDNAYIAGSTSANGYPTVAALQRSLAASEGAPVSGFLTGLSADGSAFVFSTYIAGTGITSLALDATKSSLLVVGHIALQHFPVPDVRKPATSASYPSLLRLSLDGQTVSAPVVLGPGTESDIFVATDDSRWIVPTGTLPTAANASANVVDPSLGVSTATVSFQTPVAVTQIASSPQILTVTNNGGSSLPLTFAISGDFTLVDGCPVALTASTSCILEIGFAPSQPGERDGVLSITTGSGFTPTYVSLTGTALDILPSNNGTLNLGQTLLGEPIVAWYKIQQPLVSLTATTNSSLFGVAIVADTGSGPGSLPASSFTKNTTANCNNCWLGVQFYSQTVGAASAALVLTSNAGGSPYMLALTGDALPVTGLLLTPIMQDFGTIVVNSTSAPMTFMLADLLTNSAAVTVQSVNVSGDFVLTANESGGPECTGTVPSTGSCFVQVSFAPTATGQREGTLTIVTTEGTATAALSGTGTADSGIGINPTSLNFTNVPGATATQQSVVLTNASSSSVTVDTPSVSDASFTVTSGCSTLQAGASCNLVVGFVPQSVTVSATLSIPVTSGATITNYTVALKGSYTSQNAGLQIVANAANFGSTTTGGLEATRMFTVNNLTAKDLSVAFTLPRQFPSSTVAPCTTIPAESNCNLSVSFLPVTGGPLTGTVIAQGTPTDGSTEVQALVYMLGYGAASGRLLISGNTIPNTPMSFGQVNSGQTAQQILTLTNNGSNNLTVHRITSQPPFLSTGTCGSIMAPNANCTITMAYTPIDQIAIGTIAVPRVDTGSVTIESDSVTSPDIMQFSGIVVPVTSSDPSSSAVLSAFVLSQSSLTFPNTQIGNASAKQTVTLTNTGTVNIHVLSTVVSDDFISSTTCTVLLPGGTCTLTVQFAPTQAAPTSGRSGTLEILSDAGTSLEFISLLGASTPAALTFTPTSLNFGTVNVGANGTLSVTVTDTASVPVTFLGLSASGDYTVAAGSCPASGSTLAAGASCVLSVTFTPTTVGTRLRSLSLANDASQLPLAASLAGVAVASQLKVTPGSLAFGSIDQGYPAVLTLTLLNTGSASVTGIANAVSGSNANDFAVTAPCTVTALAPNQGCSETVTFTPNVVGARTATLTIASSDPNGPAQIALSGVGVAAGTFVLSVNGVSTASATVVSGSPGSYALALTPKNGFVGQVALTCTPITSGEYTSCSLLASTLTLASSPLGSTATINTITSDVGTTIIALGGLMLVPFAGLWRRTRDRKTPISLAIFATLSWSLLNGCGVGVVPLLM